MATKVEVLACSFTCYRWDTLHLSLSKKLPTQLFTPAHSHLHQHCLQPKYIYIYTHTQCLLSLLSFEFARCINTCLIEYYHQTYTKTPEARLASTHPCVSHCLQADISCSHCKWALLSRAADKTSCHLWKPNPQLHSHKLALQSAPP